MKKPSGHIDGGGGDDCIITFDGTSYRVEGGSGQDKIASGVPADASDAQIAALCGKQTVNFLGLEVMVDRPAASATSGSTSYADAAVLIVIALIGGAIVMRVLNALWPPRTVRD